MTDREWTDEEMAEQTATLLECVGKERERQEDLWGVQNIPDLQKGATGAHEVGRSYRQMASIMKYQCDRNRAEGHRSMDVVLLEEIFEALEVAVEIAEASDPAEILKLKEQMIEELVQSAAVCLKWAAMVERDEPRHG
jgi:hypothetical protein